MLATGYRLSCRFQINTCRLSANWRREIPAPPVPQEPFLQSGRRCILLTADAAVITPSGSGEVFSHAGDPL